MKKFLSIVMVIMLVMGVSIYAFANNFGRDYREDDYDFNFSRAQEDSLEDLEDKYEDDLDDLMDDLRDKSEDLHDLYFDKDSNPKEIIKVQEEINSLRDEVYTLRIEMKLEIREILTVEQLEDMEDYGMMGYGMIGGRGFRDHRASRMMNGHHRMGW